MLENLDYPKTNNYGFLWVTHLISPAPEHMDLRANSKLMKIWITLLVDRFAHVFENLLKTDLHVDN